MTKNISNAVLLEKIENVEEKIDNISKSINNTLIPQIEKNTEFRIQAKAIIAVISFIFGTLGALIVNWLSKLLGR